MSSKYLSWFWFLGSCWYSSLSETRSASERARSWSGSHHLQKCCVFDARIPDVEVQFYKRACKHLFYLLLLFPFIPPVIPWTLYSLPCLPRSSGPALVEAWKLGCSTIWGQHAEDVLLELCHCSQTGGKQQACGCVAAYSTSQGQTTKTKKTEGCLWLFPFLFHSSKALLFYPCCRNALVCSHDHLTLFLTLVSGLEFIRFDLDLVRAQFVVCLL